MIAGLGVMAAIGVAANMNTRRPAPDYEAMRSMPVVAAHYTGEASAPKLERSARRPLQNAVPFRFISPSRIASTHRGPSTLVFTNDAGESVAYELEEVAHGDYRMAPEEIALDRNKGATITQLDGDGKTIASIKVESLDSVLGGLQTRSDPWDVTTTVAYEKAAARSEQTGRAEIMASQDALGRAAALYEQRQKGSEHGMMTVDQIVEHVNAVEGTRITGRSLLRHIDDMGLGRRSDGRARAERIARVGQYGSSGKSVREIATMLDCSVSTVYRDMRAYKAAGMDARAVKASFVVPGTNGVYAMRM